VGTSRAIRFLHLADLHLTPCPSDGRCGPYDVACHACIKREILARLRERLLDRSTRLDLLLLAGDLTERRDSEEGLRWTTAPLTELVAAAKTVGTTVAGVTGEHDGEDSTTALRDMLGWTWLLRTGEVNRESGIAVFGIEGRRKCDGLAGDFAKLRTVPGETSVLLAHGELSAFKAAGPRFDYYALGHRHRAQLRPASARSSTFAAYPGHLFSYWDGDGKAWPVHVIEGVIRLDGTVAAEAFPVATKTAAPETRRMYVAHADVGRPEGTIVFEHSPGAEFFAGIGIAATVEDQKESGRFLRHVTRISYRSRAEMKGVLKAVLDGLPKDVFVWPSTGVGWRDRADYGRRLSRLRFDEYVVKVFKRQANTQ
jgi:DNA repair exonuclease SbcCD nuclease subunit